MSARGNGADGGGASKLYGFFDGAECCILLIRQADRDDVHTLARQQGKKIFNFEAI